jgi:hypothetical protein
VVDVGVKSVAIEVKAAVHVVEHPALIVVVPKLTN